MGLDTFTVNPKINEEGMYQPAPDVLFENISLCGGIFSGEGASFRGKVYNDYIEQMTGVSLYQDYIPPETVKEMYKKLKEYGDDENMEEFFRICSENGFALYNWW